MNKRLVLGIVIVALVSAGIVGIWAIMQPTGPVQAQEDSAAYDPLQVITVVGQGMVTIEPDIARLSLGVETSAESVSLAVADNEAKMALILAALEDLGIESKDIQTTNYSVQLDRYPEAMPRAEAGNEQPPAQFRVSNMVNVTIRDLDGIGDVLDAVIEAGANNIWGVSFGLDDNTTAQDEARADAITNALKRAEALAELNGVALGPVMSVSEVLGGGVSPMMAVTVERAAAGGGSINPGELQVTYQVQVTYFIDR